MNGSATNYVVKNKKYKNFSKYKTINQAASPAETSILRGF